MLQPESRSLAQKALGHPLSGKHPVHHANEIFNDNRPENLVICESHRYHMLLHARMKAKKACGNPNGKRCKRCRGWGDPSQMIRSPKHPSYRHNPGECLNFSPEQTAA